MAYEVHLNKDVTKKFKGQKIKVNNATRVQRVKGGQELELFCFVSISSWPRRNQHCF